MSTALLLAMALTVVTVFVGIASIVNAVRLNKAKHDAQASHQTKAA